LGDVIGLGVAAVGVVVGVAGVATGNPILAGIGLGLAVAGLGIAGDVVGCDEGVGIGCGVF
jgi:hypothetical protein